MLISLRVALYWIYFTKHKNIFTFIFFIISQYLNGTVHYNPPPLSYIINSIDVDDVPTQGAWAIVTIVSTLLSFNAVRCHYNTVNFLPNAHKIHPIASPLAWDIGCILCAKIMIYTLPQSLQWYMQYLFKLDQVITALNCIWFQHQKAQFWLNCHEVLWCIIKTHVRGFFDTDLNKVSWHFATHEAVRPSGF